jgi:2-succinyl-5-enolpyruvyl-6-hydroxy-3-cyclohexene-1-carboxylate synthase
MSASFNVNIKDFKSTSTVWMRTADLQDLSGTATMTKSETDTVTKHLSDAGKIFQKISSTTLTDVAGNVIVNQMINTFNNTKVRSQEKITNTKKHTDELIKYISTRYQKDIDKMKSDAGKKKKSSVRDAVLSFFSDSNKSNLKLMFDLQNHLVDAKEILINKMDKVSDISTFVKTKDGFKVTGSEGFVAIDIDGSAVKLVDRMEFSANNFSKDIIKGWEK